MRKYRLPFLSLLLVGLLLYVYLTDQASPVYPHGEFWPLVLFASTVAFAAGIMALTVWLLRRRPPDS